jgi:cysteinyl-tRNA synthetase
MGGIDLIFPHHQNEIAQTEGITGKRFCRCWAHNGHVMEGGKKMAKRDGGFVTLRTLEEKYPGKERVLYRAFRMMCAQSHYRQGFDFSWEKLEAATKTVEGIDTLLRRLNSHKSVIPEVRKNFKEVVDAHVAGFLGKIADDLDMPGALVELFNLARTTNANMEPGSAFTGGDAQYVTDALRKIGSALPVFDFSLLEGESVPADVAEMVAGVMAAKLAKDWPKVDALRAAALAKGWKIVDQKDRTSRAERA